MYGMCDYLYICNKSSNTNRTRIYNLYLYVSFYYINSTKWKDKSIRNSFPRTAWQDSEHTIEMIEHSTKKRTFN